MVPGHVAIAPLLKRIVDLQALAPETERARWQGGDYKVAELAGNTIQLYRGRAIVPDGAADVKSELMRMSHDAMYHMTGVERMVRTLRDMSRVHWKGMATDVAAYVATCARCLLATDTGPRKCGTSEPTHALRPNFTWYLDLKGPMPHGTGYLLAVVDAFSRFTRLRYLRGSDGKELVEELEEVVAINATCPAVIRCDNGAPFNAGLFAAWCKTKGIRLVHGVPHHSQGQGMVETRFRGIAHALVAVLGRKASRDWWVTPHLQQLEMIINSMHCEPIGGSPAFVLFGVEPRLGEAASVDWSTPRFGSAVGVGTFTYEELQNAVAEGHTRMRAVQGLAMVGSSLAQALTKSAYDAKRLPNTFKVGDVVALYRAPTNRLEPHFSGPYEIVSSASNGNMVTLRGMFDRVERVEVHVSRVIHFDISRASSGEITSAQLDAGSFAVERVLDHRPLADGTLEFHLSWHGTPVQTWEPAAHVRLVAHVQDYCRRNSLTLVAPPTAALGRGARAART